MHGSLISLCGKQIKTDQFTQIPYKDMNYIFFDTETTGLPKDWKAPMTKLDNWPRIIQLAWMVCDSNGKEISRFVSLIKPDGWTVPVEKFWIEHGYSTEKCEQEGLSLVALLDECFVPELQICHTIVSHNMSYDYNVLGAEMIRYGLKSANKPVRICTKEASTDYCDLPKVWGKPKWPKLQELYVKLFGKEFVGAHDAMDDVVALKDCFFELKRIGVI